MPRPRAFTRHMEQNDDLEKTWVKNTRAKNFFIFPIDKSIFLMYNTYIKNNTSTKKEK